MNNTSSGSGVGKIPAVHLAGSCYSHHYLDHHYDSK